VIGGLLCLRLPKIKRSSSREDGPRDTRELVGQCDDDLVVVYSLRLHLRNPEPEMILGPVETQHARSGTVDQQLAQIWITSLGDAEQALLASNLSAFLWARRLNNVLSTRLYKSLAEQDSKLVHR
jgi:hypothetical protein